MDKKIVPCKCPRCNASYENYWDMATAEPHYSDNGGLTMSYEIWCEDCGKFFYYEEIYNLDHTQVS